jgi:flavin-binding protein dodecin
MADSVYRVTELIGVSPDSWEAAARNSIETAAQTLRDLRIAETHRFDVTIENGKVKSYRVRLDVSFKYEPDARTSKGAAAEEWEHTRHELQ